MRIAGVPFFMDAVVSGFIASFQMQEPDIQIDQSYGHFNELDASPAGRRHRSRGHAAGDA